jgi:hypothetical protein
MYREPVAQNRKDPDAMLPQTVEMARRMAAEHHNAPLDQVTLKELKPNPGYQPRYPTFEQFIGQRGVDVERSRDPYDESGHRAARHDLIREYDFGARATHSAEFEYDPERGHRALYGINSREEIPPSLWAD